MAISSCFVRGSAVEGAAAAPAVALAVVSTALITARVVLAGSDESGVDALGALGVTSGCSSGQRTLALGGETAGSGTTGGVKGV